MEPESTASKANRRARILRQQLTEFALAAIFIAAFFIGDRMAESTSSFLTKSIAFLLPVIALTIWWAFYANHIKSLREFEQVIATRSLAIACGVTLWVTTSWGLAALFIGVPVLPLALAAPLAAVVYAIVRVVFMIRYR